MMLSASAGAIRCPLEEDHWIAGLEWCEAQGAGLPVGISAAGLINPRTGLALTSNLPATGKPFPADIAKAAGRPVAWINDCRALTLSEASLGAARGADPAVGLILGTGVAGGVAPPVEWLVGPIPLEQQTRYPRT